MSKVGATSKEYPLTVQNLRRIWNEKKRDTGITQAEAAEKLGWTQGALSQYLNNTTKMSPSAVIKLANFFDVDPLQINPELFRSSRDIQIENSVNKARLSYPSLKAIVIYVEKTLLGTVNGKDWKLPVNSCLVCEPAGRSEKGPYVWYDLGGELGMGDASPPGDQLTAKYRLHSVYIELS